MTFISITDSFSVAPNGSPCYPAAAASGARPGAEGARTTSARRTRSWTRTARLGKRFNDIHIQHRKPPTVLPSSHPPPHAQGASSFTRPAAPAAQVGMQARRRVGEDSTDSDSAIESESD